MQLLILILSLISVVLLAALLYLYTRDAQGRRTEKQELLQLRSTTDRLIGSVSETNTSIGNEFERNRRESADLSMKSMAHVAQSINDINRQTTDFLNMNAKQQKESFETVTRVLGEVTENSRRNNERLLTTLNDGILRMSEQNEKKLAQIQTTVDERLNNTLTARLDSSFKTVSEQLSNVYTAMGEMKKLSGGVTDLQRLLTNVKARGTWAEVQLGAILEETLPPDRFLRNAKCGLNSAQMVEFAIKLPGKGDGEVLLPIDSKFPIEDYSRLSEASERCEPESVQAALKALEKRITDEAKTIHDYYINPPYTTDFAILFLATEGLYAEALRGGLAEKLQREYRIVIAGPTTITALLNSLSIGFRTLAIDKRTNEIREILAAAKTQYGKFADTLEKVKKKLNEATNQVEEAQKRTRVINTRLRNVEKLDDDASDRLLGLDDDEE